MKALTVSALVCAMMALTRAAVLPEETAGSGEDQTEKSHLVKRSTSCYRGWSEFHGRCFYYVSLPMTWAKAEKHCVSMGGNLASIHNMMEYHEIQRLIFYAGHVYKEAWIGGSDAQEENQWLWSDGTPFNYLGWCAGEPNNHNGRQNCVHINHGALKCWDDSQCSLWKPSVCVRKM